MNSYLESMEREDEGGSPSFIRHRANRSFEMQNQYLSNCQELSEDQRFVYLYDIHGKQVGKGLLQDRLSVIYYMINQYLQMMQLFSYKVLQSWKLGFMN